MKKFLSGLVIGALLAGTVTFAASNLTAIKSSFGTMLNGKKVTQNVVTINGTYYADLKQLASNLGIKYSVDTKGKNILLGETPSKVSLTGVLDYFKKNGLNIGGKTVKAASMIGAKDGFGISINGSNVEIYEFDPNSKDELAVANLKAAKDGYIEIVGIKFNVVLNGNIILVGYDEHPDKDKIVELFKKYK